MKILETIVQKGNTVAIHWIQLGRMFPARPFPAVFSSTLYNTKCIIKYSKFKLKTNLRKPIKWR